MTLSDHFEYLGSIFTKIRNVFLFGFSILSAQVIVNPYRTFAQKDFFLIEEGDVVVNLLPSRRFSFIRDLYHHLKYLLTGKNISHQTISDKRFNFIFEEVENLKAGTSNLKGFKGKTMSEKVFYFKDYDKLTDEQKERLSTFVPQDKQKINFFSVESSGGAILDSVEYNASKTSSNNQNYMICCNPRDVNYSLYLKDGFLKNISTASGSNVIAFNYRGIDRSQGLIFTEQALIDDTVAQVKRLVENNNISAKSITLYGFCLGGAIATLAAANLKKQGIEVGLYNDRSFLSISKFVIGILCPEQANTPIAWIRTFFAVLFYPIIWVLIKLSGWQMDAQSAWSSIHDKYKMYSVVKTVENLEVKQKDGVIHTSLASISSLYLKQEDTNDKCFGFDARLNQHCFFNDGHFLKPSQLQHEQSTITDSIVGFLGRSIMV